MYRLTPQYQPTNPFQALSHVYRYGFNGQEIIGQSNKLLEYDARVFDPTLAQWLSIDPEGSKYSYISPYSAFNLNPLIYIDPDGADIVLYSTDQNGKKKIAAVVKTDKAKVEYCIDERYLEVLKIASGTERQSSPILISIPNEVWDEIDTQIGAPDALILTAGVVGGMFTGGLASMSAVLFLDGPQNGELHLYTSTSAPFSNFAFIGGDGVELGAGTFSPPDNDPTAQPSSDNFSGASFSISVGFGALGGTLGLPAGQTEPNRGNPLHANGGWTTLTAGATIVGVPDLKSGGFVGEVETEHEEQLLECPE